MSKSIVLTVCEEMGITPEEFFGPRKLKHLTHARREAIDRMMAAGFSMTGVAAAIRRNYSSVQYWVYHDYRKRRSDYFREYHAKHPIPHVRKLRADKRKHLLEVYLDHGLAAAKPVAIAYGINPATISHYARAIGIKGKPGRPRRVIHKEGQPLRRCPASDTVSHDLPIR
jgi:hypothetical protein